MEKPTISRKHPHLCWDFAIQEANPPPTASPPLQLRSQLTLDQPNKTSQQDGQQKKYLPGEPKTLIFGRYDPYIEGPKPSFFMVLGSKVGYTSPIYTPKKTQQIQPMGNYQASTRFIFFMYISPPPIFSIGFPTGATWPSFFGFFFSPWKPQTWRVPPRSARQHPRLRSHQSPRRRTWRLDSRLPTLEGSDEAQIFWKPKKKLESLDVCIT